MPESRGVLFKDKYLAENWERATPTRETNCYMRVAYKLDL